MPTRRYTVSDTRSTPHHELPSIRTTDTVVVGNGPAALCLSYILHGHVPTYDPVTHGPHPDPVLHSKLQKFQGRSLFEILDSPSNCERLTDHFAASNMSYSTQALPLNTLLDTLLRPNADTELGEVKSRIQWDKRPSRRVDHIVLGSAPEPGGQWTEDPLSTSWDIGTLSYSEMFSLPGYSFPEHYRRVNKRSTPDLIRPARRDVSSYYASYPKAVGISSSIYSSVFVKRISRNPNGFTVQVQRRKTAETFVIVCKHLVLASGVFSYSIPPPPIFFPLLNHLSKPQRRPATSDPILVIGSGFSAADVILSAPPDRKIIHIFKWKPERPSPLKGCHPQAYPEYAEIYRRMKLASLPTSAASGRLAAQLEQSNSTRNWAATYEGFPNAQVISVSGDNAIRILKQNDDVAERKIDELKYCVGRRGSLGFLSTDMRKEAGVVDVAWVSGETLRRRVEAGVEISRNVFVVGSLTGDSLVRYIMGACTYAAGRIVKDIEDRRNIGGVFGEPYSCGDSSSDNTTASPNQRSGDRKSWAVPAGSCVIC